MKNYYWLRLAILVFVIFMTGMPSVFAKTITSTTQGGLWSEKTTWTGGVVPTETDDVVITSVVTTGDVYYTSRTLKMASLTVNEGGKILREAERSGHYSLEISGDLVNNGEIIDYLDYFDIHLFGDLENNGKLMPRLIYLKGENQHISTSKAIECKTFNLDMTDNEVIASSDLLFKNCYIPSSGTKQINMRSFNLSLSADIITYDNYYGKVGSASTLNAPLKFDETGTLFLDKSILGSNISGNLKIESPTYAFIQDMVVDGDLTIADEVKVSSYRDLQSLKIHGNFTNYGVINKDTVSISDVTFPPIRMKVYISGNVNNYGNSGISQIYVNTNGESRTITGNFDGDVKFQQSEGSDTPGGKILINDEVNISGKLDVYADLEIGLGGTLNLLFKGSGSPIYVSANLGSITNNGNMARYHRVNDSWNYNKFSKQAVMSVDYELRDWTSRIEGIDVAVFNGQTYPGLPGSTKRWWRLAPVGDGNVSKYILKLYYNESLLNGQKEENLKVYRSTDKGESWEIISLGEYAILDTVENSISIGSWTKNESMLSEFGDFVISSGDGTVPIPSPIIVDLIGSPNVRLGAPNRFTVHLYNVSNAEAEPFIATVSVSDDIVFKQVEVPSDTGKVIYPIDSIGSASDETQLFYIPYLDPNDDFSFDVIVMGVNEGTKSVQIETGLTAAAFVSKKGSTISEVQAAWTKVTSNLNDAEKAEIKKIYGTVGKKAKAKKSKIEPYRKYVADVVIEVTDKVPGAGIISKIGSVFEFVRAYGKNIGWRVHLAIQRDLDPSYDKKSEVVSTKSVKGKIVASKDPNEKMGPSGYGDSNFISHAARMNYTIAFENKKEATAPAYRVQIVDTLSSVFDPETVIFGTTSHSGAQYNWKMNRDGNILKWDIEGIELPPNATPPEGEGYVSFSVELEDGLESGVPIENRATIIFDINEPITTNTWSNVLDKIAPVTVMNPIVYLAGDTLINVSCTSIDNENGSGVRMYQFFASVDNFPFKLIEETFENTIQYRVPDNTKHNYRFYVISTDNVNNSEKSLPEFAVLNTLLVNSEFYNGFDNKISVYPNPATDFINIDFLVENQSKVEVNLYSITGQLIKSKGRQKYIPGQHHVNMDVSLLKEGVYLAEIIFDQRSKVYKVTKK